MNNRITDETPLPSDTDGRTITGLVAGIIDDGQRLFRQQVEMLRAEFKEDVRKTKQSLAYLGVGVAIAALGVVLLSVALVYLLEYLTAPNLPLWACWAIVGGLGVAIGGIAFAVGYRILTRNNPLPDKSLTALQETVSWITNRQR
jgi:hypothetical protein